MKFDFSIAAAKVVFFKFFKVIAGGLWQQIQKYY